MCAYLHGQLHAGRRLGHGLELSNVALAQCAQGCLGRKQGRHGCLQLGLGLCGQLLRLCSHLCHLLLFRLCIRSSLGSILCCLSHRRQEVLGCLQVSACQHPGQQPSLMPALSQEGACKGIVAIMGRVNSICWLCRCMWDSHSLCPWYSRRADAELTMTSRASPWTWLWPVAAGAACSCASLQSGCLPLAAGHSPCADAALHWWLPGPVSAAGGCTG